MNSTHLNIINAINTLKNINNTINNIPHSRSVNNEQQFCRNCEVFSKQLTKLSIENQRTEEIKDEMNKYQQETRALEQLCELKDQQIQLLKAQVQKLELDKIEIRRKFQDFKNKSLKNLNIRTVY